MPPKSGAANGPRVALYLRPIAPPPTCRQLAILVGDGANRKWGGAHVTLCSFAPEPGASGSHPIHPYKAALDAASAAGRAHPERNRWAPAESNLRWYEAPNGWVFVSFGDSRTLRALCKALQDAGLRNVRGVADLHFTVGCEGTAARLAKLGLPVPPRGQDNALPVPPLMRDYLCGSTWSIVKVMVPRWPHEDPAIAMVRESVDLVWAPAQGGGDGGGAAGGAKGATLKARRQVRLVFGEVRVSEAVVAKIRQLFAALDKNRNGSIEAADFAMRIRNSKEAMKKFSALAHTFDADGDGRITLEEFASRLIDHVVKSPTDAAPGGVTIEQQVNAINDRFNKELIAQLKSLTHFCGFSDRPRE